MYFVNATAVSSSKIEHNLENKGFQKFKSNQQMCSLNYNFKKIYEIFGSFLTIHFENQILSLFEKLSAGEFTKYSGFL